MISKSARNQLLPQYFLSLFRKCFQATKITRLATYLDCWYCFTYLFWDRNTFYTDRHWNSVFQFWSKRQISILIALLFSRFISFYIFNYSSTQVEERPFDYTDCFNIRNDTENCADVIGSDRHKTCECKMSVPLDVSFEVRDVWNNNSIILFASLIELNFYQHEVFLYYGLTNFYQNHRRYVKSRDDVQLLGKLSKDPSPDCAPYKIENNTNKPIAPCGAIANSMFDGNHFLQICYCMRFI